MNLSTRLFSISMAFFLAAALLFQAGFGVPAVHAEDELPPAPVRVTTLTISLTEFEWWLVYYENNDIACRIWAEHDGLPNADEVFAACGETVYRTWLKTLPCNPNLTNNNPTTCRGLYFQKYSSTPIEKKIEVKLPPPVVWVSLEGCNPVPPDNSCSTIPYLHLTGQEPLPNENIIRINGKFDDQTFSCPGGECDLYLPATSARGQTVEFWADSSYGDSSEHYTALVRILPWGNFTAPEGDVNDPHRWYADLLSTQWQEGKSPTCAASWQVLPDIGGPPAWLRSPEGPEDLQTDVSYYYLAAMLIQAGLVKADDCPNGGLESSDVANACGVAAAEPQVFEWQNRFNDEVFNVAGQSGVPAQLLKSVFSRESQFWPGIYKTYFEAGLGQLTEPGAETVLLWNPDFFSQFCPLVLGNETCQLGFGNISPDDQKMLRGALVRAVNASCTECPIGIDLTQADFSIQIFAQSLIGNCEQVGQMYYNITNQAAGEHTSYVDLWKFTLVNYNAGPGCLGRALRAAWSAGDPLDWEYVISYLDPVCRASIGYVEDIIAVERPTPTPTAWVVFSTPNLEEPTPESTPAP